MSIELNKRSIMLDESISEKLKDGNMPSLMEVTKELLSSSVIRKSNNPAASIPLILDNELLSVDSIGINALISEIELDSLAMKATLNESWETLRSSLDKAIRTLPIIDYEAERINGSATRAMAMIPEANSVKINLEALNVSNSISFGTVNGADMSLSSNIEVDMIAGALTLKRLSSTPIAATTTAEGWVLAGDSPVLDLMIGDPTWTTDGDVAATWITKVSTNSRNSTISLEQIYDISNKSAPLKRVDVIAPDFRELSVEAYVDIDGLGNFSFWASSSGKGKIIVDGPRVDAKRIKLVFIKHKCDYSNPTKVSSKYEYIFSITEIIFMGASYAMVGNVVSDPIQMNYDNILSTSVDVDSSVPATSVLTTYLAKDIDNPSSISDFRWIQIDENTNKANLFSISNVVNFITTAAPVKVLSGAGSYMNSIYDIGAVEGTVISVDEGFDQLELKSMSVYDDLTPIESLPWANITEKRVIDRSQATLSSGNRYRLSTSIWMPTQSSHPIDITAGPLPSGAEYKVYFNGIDITDRLAQGQTSVGFVSGKNDLIVFISTGETATDIDFSMSPFPNGTMAIARPKLVQEMALISSEERVSQVREKLLVNHNPKGRVFRIVSKRSSGESIEAVRLRIELKRGLDGETPMIKSAHITTGVS